VSFLSETACEKVGELSLILDDEYPHGSIVTTGAMNAA
jgi:hypothetical protein